MIEHCWICGKAGYDDEMVFDGSYDDGEMIFFCEECYNNEDNELS